MKKIAIVTVTYNTAKDTELFLKSVEKIHTVGFALDIIIVDNGSEKPFEIPKECKELPISLIRINPNVGFTGGYNRGIQEALKRDNDYILIINNDTIVAPEMITNLLTPLERNPAIGMTVPKIYFAKGHEYHKEKYKPEELGKVIWYAGGHPDWNNVMSIHRGLDEVDHGQYDKAEETLFATGCCMLIKKEVLKKIGVFDNRYFLYYEDADFNERVKRAGYKIYYVPT
ncbi:MAG TPA: glycosyltransferase family 2 protein, partial [Candidatus Sulfotelmatobacter sp.]|nr:glycosyltransferase family 2 protein [Candidatus Sulfotelmatobacter sp.]